MTSLYVSNTDTNITNATISFELNQKYIKSNIKKIFSVDYFAILMKELDKNPEGINILYPFKQLIIRLDMYLIGKPWRMFFYDCKNDLDIALDVYKNFPHWEGIAKDDFIRCFLETQENYSPDDLATLIEVS